MTIFDLYISDAMIEKEKQKRNLYLIVPCILFCIDQLFYSIIMQYITSKFDDTMEDKEDPANHFYVSVLKTVNAVLPVISGLSLIPLVIN